MSKSALWTAKPETDKAVPGSHLQIELVLF